MQNEEHLKKRGREPSGHLCVGFMASTTTTAETGQVGVSVVVKCSGAPWLFPNFQGHLRAVEVPRVRVTVTATVTDEKITLHHTCRGDILGDGGSGTWTYAHPFGAGGGGGGGGGGPSLQ